MTSDSQLVCRRCGYANVPGDAFCGSCGAFLEWEGQQAGDDAPPPAAAGDPDVPVVGAGAVSPAGAPTVAWGQPAPTPVYPIRPPATAQPQPPVLVPAPGSATAGGLLRCPACGIANAPGRTFCQSCGAKLAETARVAEPTAAQIAAAVAAPNRPPTPPATPRAGGNPPASGGGKGIAAWIVVIAILGVLAGVGGVVGMNMLKGKGPASDATAVPSVPGASAGTTAAPSGAAPSGTTPSAGPETSATPAPPAPVSVALALSSAIASSVVGNLEKFQPGRAIDGDPATAWQEGATQEKGEWIEVGFAPATVTKVVIRNGYGASTALYRGNRRLKDVLISVGGAEPVAVRLKDSGKPQAIALAGAPGATTLRITIVSTYPGEKTSVSGTPFDDTAVSEIRVFGAVGA